MIETLHVKPKGEKVGRFSGFIFEFPIRLVPVDRRDCYNSLNRPRHDLGTNTEGPLKYRMSRLKFFFGKSQSDIIVAVMRHDLSD